MRLPKGLSIVNINSLKIAQLYQTKIVVFDSNQGTVTLNSGGWSTKHTKKCINLVLASTCFSLVQRDFEWYVIKTDANGQRKSVPFRDGIELVY